MLFLTVFSDGVASAKKSLFEVIQELVDSRLSNDMLEKAPSKYPHCTPPTKESLYYRYMLWADLCWMGRILYIIYA
jgi:asparagine synthase (glutamine-hydrolysing)